MKILLFWKIHSDRLFLLAGTNDLMKNINSLGNLKKFRKNLEKKKAKRVSPDANIKFYNMIYKKNKSSKKFSDTEW